MSASRGTAGGAGPTENLHANLPMLQAQAAMLVPGMRHARSLLDTAICVLEYFETQAARDASGDRVAKPSQADPGLAEEAERMVAMLSAFRHLT